MNAPSHRGRTAEQILTENIYHDAQGFAFRAASWLDFVQRTKHFAAFQYACIDARLAIEHLIFEQLVITRGRSFTRDEYKRCLAKPRKLNNLIEKINPDYERLQTFTQIICLLDPRLPAVNKWDVKELMKFWGALSSYLHWKAAHSETTEDVNWQDSAIGQIADIIEPLWQKISSAQSGCIAVDSMRPAVRQIWEDFRKERINEQSARIRLTVIRPPFRRS